MCSCGLSIRNGEYRNDVIQGLHIWIHKALFSRSMDVLCWLRFATAFIVVALLHIGSGLESEGVEPFRQFMPNGTFSGSVIHYTKWEYKETTRKTVISHRLKRILIIVGVIVAVLGFALVAFFCFCRRRRGGGFGSTVATTTTTTTTLNHPYPTQPVGVTMQTMPQQQLFQPAQHWPPPGYVDPYPHDAPHGYVNAVAPQTAPAAPLGVPSAPTPPLPPYSYNTQFVTAKY